MKRELATLVALFALLLAVVAFTHPSQPSSFTTPKGVCRTEDSCSIDYHGGQWHISKTTP